MKERKKKGGKKGKMEGRKEENRANYSPSSHINYVGELIMIKSMSIKFSFCVAIA